MDIEVVYALQDDQTVFELTMTEGATVQDALQACGLLDKSYSDSSLNIIPGQTPVGIFGEKVTYQELLRDGDRVEVYRPLQIDPMQARRARAQAQKPANKTKPVNRLKS